MYVCERGVATYALPFGDRDDDARVTPARAVWSRSDETHGDGARSGHGIRSDEQWARATAEAESPLLWLRLRAGPESPMHTHRRPWCGCRFLQTPVGRRREPASPPTRLVGLVASMIDWLTSSSTSTDDLSGATPCGRPLAWTLGTRPFEQEKEGCQFAINHHAIAVCPCLSWGWMRMMSLVSTKKKNVRTPAVFETDFTLTGFFILKSTINCRIDFLN